MTGASRGIGRAIAERLAAGGATVICVTRGTNAEATASAITAAGGAAEAVGADVTDSAAVVSEEVQSPNAEQRSSAHSVALGGPSSPPHPATARAATAAAVPRLAERVLRIRLIGRRS